MNVLRAEAAEQGNRVLEVLERQRPGALEQLHADALGTVEQWTEVRVVFDEERATDSGCSVAGGYYSDTTPPTIVVARSASRRRRGFTVLHELGHHLQRNDTALAAAVRARTSDRARFEDVVCDSFASKVLITEDELDSVVEPTRSVTAGAIVELYVGTGASRAACCVRAAERLSGHGAVALMEANGVVSFAIGRGEVFPPARNSDQSSTPLVAQALARRTDTDHDSTHIVYRTGATSDQLYGQAAWCDGYIVTVMVRDRPGWKRFAPPRPFTRKFPTAFKIWCEVCQDYVENAGRCDVCREPKCPAGHCPCTTAKDRPCQKCFLVLNPARFANPSATVCKDCSE